MNIYKDQTPGSGLQLSLSHSIDVVGTVLLHIRGADSTGKLGAMQPRLTPDDVDRLAAECRMLGKEARGKAPKLCPACGQKLEAK